jgi:hypothetical protein
MAEEGEQIPEPVIILDRLWLRFHQPGHFGALPSLRPAIRMALGKPNRVAPTSGFEKAN